MAKRFFSSLICVIVLLALIPAAFVPALAAGEQELHNFPFNDEAAQGQFFSSAGESATLEWVSQAGVGHGDDTAIKVTHIDDTSYKSSDNALRLTLPEPLSVGGIYRIVAWVYAPSAENPGKDTLTGPGIVLNDDYPGEQGVVKFPVDFGTLPLDEWKGIDVTLPVQETPLTTIDFRIVINDEPKHPDVWYWDNIEVYQIGDLEEVIVPEWNDPMTKNKKGIYADLDYEIWSEKSEDPVSMTLTGPGTFECTWNAFNSLFRTGKKLGSTTTYEEYGDIIIDYGAEVTITRGDVNYLCVYGWTEDPLIEFYIVEDHGSYRPGSDFLGTYEIDGASYELYKDTRIEKPSIQGTKTFEQYFGIRVDKRTEGTIPVSEHFKAWENMGLDMSGKLFEVSLCVEGFNSGGSANVYKHILTVGEDTYGAALDPATAEPTPESVETPAPTETSAPTDTSAPTETPAATDAPDDSADTPSNLPLIIGLSIAGVIVIAAVIFFVAKKRKT